MIDILKVECEKHGIRLITDAPLGKFPLLYWPDLKLIAVTAAATEQHITCLLEHLKEGGSHE